MQMGRAKQTLKLDRYLLAGTSRTGMMKTNNRSIRHKQDATVRQALKAGCPDTFQDFDLPVIRAAA